MSSAPETKVEGSIQSCTFSWNSRRCTFPDGPCLIEDLYNNHGIIAYWHHGRDVDGDCAIKAQEPGYVPWDEQEHRGDPR